MLTYPWENPNMLRTFTALPSIVYFIGRSIEMIYITVVKHPRGGPLRRSLSEASRYGLLGGVIIISLLFLSSIYELRTYFKYQVFLFNDAFEVKKDVSKIDFTKPIIFKEVTK